MSPEDIEGYARITSVLSSMIRAYMHGMSLHELEVAADHLLDSEEAMVIVIMSLGHLKSLVEEGYINNMDNCPPGRSQWN